MHTSSAISVIIPTRNRPEFLKDAIDSVLTQSLQASEIIIIDDHSDENFQKEIVQISELNPMIQLVCLEEQNGVSFCRNLGIEQASGEYLLFLDDDDTLNPNMFEDSLVAIEDADVVSCRTQVFIDRVIKNHELERAYNWQKTARFDQYKLEEDPAEHIFIYHPMIHSFLFRKLVFEKIRFPEDLSYGEDFYTWFQVANSGFKFKKLEFVGGNCKIHKGSSSSKASVSDKLKFYTKILSELVLSKEVRNLAHFKTAIVLWKSKNLKFIPFLLKALLNPVLFVRHSKHFLEIHK